MVRFLDQVTEENGGTRILPRSHKGLVAPTNLHSIVRTPSTTPPIPFYYLQNMSLIAHSVPNHVLDGGQHMLDHRI